MNREIDKGQQQELAGMPAPGAELQLRGRGEHSGEQVRKRDPQKYALVVELHREGLGILKIAQLLSMGAHTVQQIVERAAGKNATEEQNEAAKQLLRAARRLAAERIVEDLADDDKAAKIAARDKAVVLGIVNQNHELLDGKPTARVIHEVEAVPANEEFERWLKEGAIDAESAELPEATEGGNDADAGAECGGGVGGSVGGAGEDPEGGAERGD